MEITKKNGLILIVDGAQISGCIDFSLKDFEDTIYFFTGHKSFYGPQGTGGFLIKGDFNFSQVFSGGSGFASFSKKMPDALPELFGAGTANVHSFAGLRAAVEILQKEKPYERLQKLTSLLYNELKKNRKFRLLHLYR